jgi:anti-sigma B factor antagonist
MKPEEERAPGSPELTKAASPRLYLETVDGVTVATFAGPDLIAEDVIAEVGDQLTELATGPAASKVLLNFREVRLMSSTMLAILLKFARRVEESGGRLKLCRIAPDLRVIFQITRFDRLFDIYDEEWAALDSF